MFSGRFLSEECVFFHCCNGFSASNYRYSHAAHGVKKEAAPKKQKERLTAARLKVD
jgi:hypothetical protein